jgi:hypothetical protein
MTQAEHDALWARACRALMPLEPIRSPKYRPGARGVVVLADDDWVDAHGPGGEDAEREATRPRGHEAGRAARAAA